MKTFSVAWLRYSWLSLIFTAFCYANGWHDAAAWIGGTWLAIWLLMFAVGFVLALVVFCMGNGEPK